MVIKSFDTLAPSKRWLWMIVRHLVPRQSRWFYEGCLGIPGQLWYEDRRLLYGTVRAYRPETVFEVGTWYGGGSTYFISSALKDNGRGMLHTVESDRAVYAMALQSYSHQLSHLRAHVKLYVGTSTGIYPNVLKDVGRADMVFLDGGDDPRQTASEFNMFARYMGRGSVLLMHDWDNEKMSVLRPLIERSADWIPRAKIIPPRSVGFAVYERL